MPAETRLRYAALFYAAGLALHTVDHFRRGVDAVTPQVLWAGNVSTLLGVTTVVLVLLGHRLGPLAAAITGLPVAIGVSAVHLLPEWSSALSDAFPGAHGTGVTAMSWTVVLIEITGALAMGIIGLSIVRTRGTVARPFGHLTADVRDELTKRSG
jgi:hypothetical protein